MMGVLEFGWKINKLNRRGMGLWRGGIGGWIMGGLGAMEDGLIR